MAKAKSIQSTKYSMSVFSHWLGEAGKIVKKAGPVLPFIPGGGAIGAIASGLSKYTPYITAATGLGASYASKRASDKLAGETADITERNLAPYLEAGTYGLDRFRKILDTQYGSKIGKPSPILKARHEQNETNIGRAVTRNLGASKRYWGAAGDTGRGRGEQFRINLQGSEALGRENINYGEAQESYLDAGNKAYLGGLGALAAYGASATGASIAGATTAAGIKAGGKQGFNEDIGALAGTIEGAYENNLDYKALLDAINRYKINPAGTEPKVATVPTGIKRNPMSYYD